MGKKIPPNQICPLCNSGKKYKKCCGTAEKIAARAAAAAAAQGQTGVATVAPPPPHARFSPPPTQEEIAETARAAREMQVYEEARKKKIERDLRQMAFDGDLERSVALIKLKADVNATDDDGCTAIFMASQEGHTAVVAHLIEFKGDVNLSCTADNSSPIYMAAQEGHLACVRVLIKGKADVDMAETDGNCYPLYVSAQAGHAPVVKELIAANCRMDMLIFDGSSPICASAEKGHLEVVNALIDGNTDVNVARKDGCTPLLTSAWEGKFEVVRALVQARADINAQRYDGMTALDSAASNRHVAVARYLIKHGAVDTNAESDDGTKVTALEQWDDVRDNPEMMALLRSRRCASCKSLKHKTKLKPCKGCMQVLYCSQQCQKKHWPKHRKACKAEAGRRKQDKQKQPPAAPPAQPVAADAHAAISAILNPQNLRIRPLAEGYDLRAAVDAVRAARLAQTTQISTESTECTESTEGPPPLPQQGGQSSSIGLDPASRPDGDPGSDHSVDDDDDEIQRQKTPEQEADATIAGIDEQIMALTRTREKLANVNPERNGDAGILMQQLTGQISRLKIQSEQLKEEASLRDEQTNHQAVQTGATDTSAPTVRTLFEQWQQEKYSFNSPEFEEHALAVYSAIQNELQNGTSPPPESPLLVVSPQSGSSAITTNTVTSSDDALNPSIHEIRVEGVPPTLSEASVALLAANGNRGPSSSDPSPQAGESNVLDRAAADAYMARHGIKQLLADLLTSIARHRPDNIAAYAVQLLSEPGPVASAGEAAEDTEDEGDLDHSVPIMNPPFSDGPESEEQSEAEEEPESVSEEGAEDVARSEELVQAISSLVEGDPAKLAQVEQSLAAIRKRMEELQAEEEKQ